MILNEPTVTSQTNIIYPEGVKDSCYMDYSTSLINSSFNQQLNYGSRKQIGFILDRHERNFSVDLSETQNDHEQMQQLIYALRQENLNLIQTNNRTQSLVDSLKIDNLNLNNEVILLKKSYNRISGQVKEIFKKQRVLIDENSNLHDLLINNRQEVQQINEKSKRLTKSNRQSETQFKLDQIIDDDDSDLNCLLINNRQQEMVKQIKDKPKRLIRSNPYSENQLKLDLTIDSQLSLNRIQYQSFQTNRDPIAIFIDLQQVRSSSVVSIICQQNKEDQNRTSIKDTNNTLLRNNRIKNVSQYMTPRNGRDEKS